MSADTMSGVSLEAVLPPGVLEKVKAGDIIKWEDLAKLLARPESPPIPVKVPLPAAFTKEQTKAIERLAEVFNSVVPLVLREVTPEEISKLVDERQVLDSIEKLAANRKGDIRTIALNHVDVLYRDGRVDEAVVVRDLAGEPLTDKDGHVLAKVALVPDDPKLGQKISAEPRGGTTNLDVEVFQGLADDDDVECITHRDYLDVTDPVRLINYNKLMLKIRSKPEILTAVKEATKTGSGSISVNARKL